MAPTRVDNMYTMTAVRWKGDGSRLVTGSLGGYVDVYDACIRRYIYMGKYEFTYTSLSSVIVKRLSNQARTELKSHYNLELRKVNIRHDRFLVAHTSDTLLLADIGMLFLFFSCFLMYFVIHSSSSFFFFFFFVSVPSCSQWPFPH